MNNSKTLRRIIRDETESNRARAVVLPPQLRAALDARLGALTDREREDRAARWNGVLRRIRAAA